FNGVIDDVRVYNRTLSPAEVQTDMSTPVNPPPSGNSDTTPPTAPTGVTKTGASATSISIPWNASTDNVGVAGYGVYKNGSSVATTSATAYTASGLTCGTSYTLAVDAFDAAGNHSAKASVSASTSACPDTQAPTTPTGLSVGGATQTSVSLSWTSS